MVSKHRKPIDQIARDVGTYRTEAYEFVMACVTVAVGRVHGPLCRRERRHRHVSGLQLCEGFLAYAFHKYGGMAVLVMNQWGVRSTNDVGRIVFALIDAGYLQKHDRDSPEDFRGVFDFRDAFAGYKIVAAP